MSPLALLIIAAVLLVIVRQFQPRPIRPLGLIAIPAVLLLLGLRGHYTGSLAVVAAVLAADLLLSVVLGYVRGESERVWRAADGAAYRRGTRTTAALWGVSIAARVAASLAASPLGVHAARANELSLLLGASFASQHVVIARRAGLLGRAPAAVPEAPEP